jgi:hypothetical protein
MPSSARLSTLVGCYNIIFEGLVYSSSQLLPLPVFDLRNSVTSERVDAQLRYNEFRSLSLFFHTSQLQPRRAAKGTNLFLAVCFTSVTTPSYRTFLCARRVFIFVRKFSRGIFLRKPLSKVAASSVLFPSLPSWEISKESHLGPKCEVRLLGSFPRWQRWDQ